jgi:hypothetical protein
VVTRRSALDSQPVPGLIAESSSERQRTQSIRTDAAIAVTWLNAAQDAKATASYLRVVSIRKDLEELRLKREEVKRTFGPDPTAWEAAVHQHKKNRAALESAVKRGQELSLGLSTTFPADQPHTREAERRSFRWIERFAAALNARLAKYKFHPEIAYAYRLPGSISVMQNLWAGGMVPDVKERWFQTKLNGWTISEGDAVLSLVRLDLTSELHKVALCGMCEKRWRVAAKSHYKFCSDGCRETYYAKSPNYHRRKAAAQRKYRENRKRAEAAGIA